MRFINIVSNFHGAFGQDLRILCDKIGKSDYLNFYLARNKDEARWMKIGCNSIKLPIGCCMDNMLSQC